MMNKNKMENNQQAISKKDLMLGLLAGVIIGLLILPILKTAKSELYYKIYLAVVPFFALGSVIGIRVAFAIGKKIAAIWQIAKFGLIGVLNTLVDIGVLALIISASQNSLGIDAKEFVVGAITYYSFFKAISFIIANINSYLWNKYWTFDNQETKQKTQTEFLQFIAVSIIGFGINNFFASYVFTNVNLAGLNAGQMGLIGAAVGSVVGLAWNFIGYKFIVFKK